MAASKILVADDDVDTCEILSDIFQERGYSVVTAGTGSEAIDKASQTTFDVALIDIRLPDIDGVELIATLKGMRTGMVVVMITGYASIETAVRALNEGASAYIHKPLNIDEVLATVKEALEKQRLVIENRRLYQEAQRELDERKRLEDQLLQSKKMEAIGTLAGGVAHDLNNLLTPIIAYSEIVLIELEADSPLRGDVEEIRKAGRRAESLIRQLLTFSRNQVLQLKVLDLNIIVADISKMLQRVIGEEINLETIFEPDLGYVKVDPGQVEQVIMNLVVNARDAMPEGGKLTIETANVYLDEEYGRRHGVEMQPGPYVMLAVSDTGIGMDEEVLAHIFEPFFTSKERGKGTGLGMATVYGIVKQSSGYIWVYSEPGQGSSVKIYLPRVEEEVELEQKKHVSEELPRGSETILVVEDNDGVRNLAREVLQRYGYNVLEVQNGEEALRNAGRHEGPIHLMLTDVVMPGMSGRELAERVQARRREVKILFMSGYTDDAIVHHGILEAGVNFLEKPFSTKVLLRRVRDVLDEE